MLIFSKPWVGNKKNKDILIRKRKKMREEDIKPGRKQNTDPDENLPTQVTSLLALNLLR